MIAIDTNILLRYLVDDEPEQALLATDLIENRLSADEPGFIAITVIAELAWVLKRRYRRTAPEIRAIVAQLLVAPQFFVDHSAVIEAALALQHPDLADALVHQLGKAADCAKTVTFDRNFARLAGVELLGA